MRMCAIRVTGVDLGGVGVCVSTVSVPAIAVAGVPVSIVSNVGEAADRHRGEASSAQREGEPIDVHTTEYYAPNDRLVTGVLPG
jgi:hypothetical protein